MTIDGVLDQIRVERAYQDAKWGSTFDDKNTANDWAAYVAQYVGQAAFAKQPEEWRRQMVKVATLAVAAIEAFDRNSGLPKRHYD
jgi:hypothetical protein